MDSLNKLMLQVLEVEIVVDDEVCGDLMTDAVDCIDHMVVRLMPCMQGLITALFTRACDRCCC